MTKHTSETEQVISLQGKIHRAHGSRTIRNNAGVQVPAPLCGTKSRRFFPSVVKPEPGYVFEVNCVKCLEAS